MHTFVNDVAAALGALSKLVPATHHRWLSPPFSFSFSSTIPLPRHSLLSSLTAIQLASLLHQEDLLELKAPAVQDLYRLLKSHHCIALYRIALNRNRIALHYIAFHCIALSLSLSNTHSECMQTRRSGIDGERDRHELRRLVGRSVGWLAMPKLRSTSTAAQF